jgi:uncharacterized SAM-binding protein YcdF (DUF218 family)
LLFTGYASPSSLATAKANAMVAMELGVPKEDIVVNEIPKDTKEEAQAAKKLIGKKPFVLVTSALHLPRAMLLFHKEGMYPIPAPCGFKKEKITTLFRRPEFAYLKNTQAAIHEYVGIIWEKLKN